MADTADKSDIFTAGEVKLIKAIVRHVKDLNTDWDAVARDLNYKDASIAKTRWSQVRRNKIQPMNEGASNGDNSAGATTGVTKGAGKAKPRGKRAAIEGDDEEGDTKGAPARKTKDASKRAATADAEGETGKGKDAKRVRASKKVTTEAKVEEAENEQEARGEEDAGENGLGDGVKEEIDEN